MTLAAAIASLIGPACAYFYQMGYFPHRPNLLLLEVWLVAIIAAFGVGVGVLSIWKRAKIAGIVCVLTNAAVLALYGFIATFFTLGGSK